MRFTIYRKEKRTKRNKSHQQLQREARKQAKLKRMSANVQHVKVNVQFKSFIKSKAVVRPVCINDIQFDCDKEKYVLHYVAIDAFGDAIPYTVTSYSYEEIYQAFIEATAKQNEYSF
tara:strand:- start:371 stop:721 length:351 start_codon:yes stop_codon:yes gene_type:complete